MLLSAQTSQTSFVAAATRTTSHSESFAFPTIHLGNGLVEIGALTTLIGSSIAESLTLGNKGPIGLPFAAISAFGWISVIRSCISGAVSDWLRLAWSLRTKASDSAIGLSLNLDLDASYQSRVRSIVDEPLGIICKVGSKQGARPRDVYSFDDSTASLLNGVAMFSPSTSQMIVHTYADYAVPSGTRDYLYKIALLVLSLIKLIEVLTFWCHGSQFLAICSSSPWAYLLLCAIGYQIQEALHSRRPFPEDGDIDIVTGGIPAVTKTGGPRKVVLGVFAPPQGHLSWRLMWAMGAMISSASLVLTYFQLNHESNQVIFVWAGFQLIWLVIRVIVFNSVEVDSARHRMLIERKWKDLSSPMKKRVLDLVLGVSNYQIFKHPRLKSAYAEELLSSHDIMRFFPRSPIRQHYSPEHFLADTLKVEIVAIIGDTTLSSAAWMMGSKLTTMELYDSCLVVLSTRQSVSLSSADTAPIVAVPAARVLAIQPSTLDKLSLESGSDLQFVPRGATNTGAGVAWYYWIPVESGRWLEIQSDGVKVLGRQTGKILNDSQMTAHLAAGHLNISISHVDEVKACVELSRQACGHLQSLWE